MNKKMSDAEKAARTVPPSVPQDQRQEVVDGATSRIESVEGGVNRDLLVKLLDEAGVERGYVGGERFREHVADYILPKLLSAVRALRAEAWMRAGPPGARTSTDGTKATATRRTRTWRLTDE